MHHPEQPPLPGIVGHRVRRERSARSRADESRLADIAVDGVRYRLVIHQPVHRPRVRERDERRQIVLTRAEAGPAQKMRNELVVCCHHVAPDANDSTPATTWLKTIE